jgi:hypothetical protein
VAGSCKYVDEPLSSGAAELVSSHRVCRKLYDVPHSIFLTS